VLFRSYSVGLLEASGFRYVPSIVRIPKVLNAESANYVDECKYLPCVCINQRKAATVLELTRLKCTVTSGNYTYRQMGSVSATNVVGSCRAVLRAATADGNSGSPVFLLVNDELIFLFSKHLGVPGVATWTPSSGPTISYRLAEVQSKINQWEGEISNDYQINVIDFFGIED